MAKRGGARQEFSYEIYSQTGSEEWGRRGKGGGGEKMGARSDEKLGSKKGAREVLSEVGQGNRDKQEKGRQRK